MLTTSKRMGTLLVCLLAVLLWLPAPAMAAETIDVDRNVSLTIAYQGNGETISGGVFDLYYVAAVSPQGEFTLAGDFAAYPVRVNELDAAGLRELAATLSGYVQRDDITPLDSGSTDAGGWLTFPCKQTGLAPGLYLVMGHPCSQNGYDYWPEPFVVCLPGQDGETGALNYDLAVVPKHDVPPEGETVTHKVLKVWDDDGGEDERPAEVTVQLLQDGDVYDTVALTAENNWRYTWDGLDASCVWNVVETVPEGYTVTVVQEGLTFVITNSMDVTTPVYPPDDDPDLPQTGQLWWPVPVLVAAGLFLILLGQVRRRGDNREA